MILGTVGTHEDPFDRLVLALDAYAAARGEEVRIQVGTTQVPLRAAHGVAMLGYDELQAEMARARIVVTHGGPASIMQVFAHGKLPVVVPRQAQFGEHVDDHQVRFARRIADRVLVVLDIDDLAPTLDAYAERAAALAAPPSGAARATAFAARFEALCEDVLGRASRRTAR